MGSVDTTQDLAVDQTVFEKNAASIAAGTSKVGAITGGNGTYHAITTKPNDVEPSIIWHDGASQLQISVTAGVTTGETAVVTVSDTANHSLNINVTVIKQ